MSNWALSTVGAYTVSDEVVVTPNSTTAHAKGSWVQVFASTPPNVTGLLLTRHRIQDASNYAHYMLFDIGIGPAGSEIVIAENISFMFALMYWAMFTQTYIPLSIPAGVRLALRAQGQVSSTQQHYMVVSLSCGSALSPVGTSLLAHGVQTATTNGTNVQFGSWGWGTSTQFVTSLPRPARGIGLAQLGQGTDSGMGGRARVLLGSSGPQVGPIFALGSYPNYVGADGQQAPSFVPCSIPAGASLFVQGFGLDGNAPTRPLILYTLH